jgi:hypothetical protein
MKTSIKNLPLDPESKLIFTREFMGKWKFEYRSEIYNEETSDTLVVTIDEGHFDSLKHAIAAAKGRGVQL